MPPAPQAHDLDLWAITGKFQHAIFSPKGTIEGFMTSTDGIPTQFVVDSHDLLAGQHIANLRTGQTLTVEGTVPRPSSKGEAAHFVYTFVRLASVNHKEPKADKAIAKSVGRVKRLNYAKHGVANGVVLDNGDFIHTRPAGFAALGMRIGDTVKAEGTARPLATGAGRVIEAHKVNGQELEAH